MTKIHYKLIAFLLFVFSTGITAAQSGRKVIDLSGQNWKLWLDTAAVWQHDTLYPPGTELSKIPVNPPTNGWGNLEKAKGLLVHLPATVEEYYWGRNGSKFGVDGNYLGVSWFTTKMTVPESMKGQRITLHFESVRFRAEVFVNHKLVGYDLVNSTPFNVDITKAVQFGQENEIEVRITDPNGNFDWRDSHNFMWGNYRTQPSHGFGGITGRVKLVATDPVFVNDVFVMNTPQVKKVNVQLSLQNKTGKEVTGKLFLRVNDYKTGKEVWHKELSRTTLHPSENTLTIPVKVVNAKLWSVNHPNLYTLTTTWKGEKTTDQVTKRFGFRWFEIRNVKGDQQFYLNGKRIVLRTAISWGFWPLNGIAPSDSLAKKQIMDAKRLGLNMLNFHRTIGQTNVLNYADELGLLYFEEPGGNQYPANLYHPKTPLQKMQTNFYMSVRNEKFFRMIKRDRSHPSLIIYNMHNERGAQPQQIDRDEMMAGHKLDPTRIITYNSSNGHIKVNKPDPRFKLHLLPYDNKFYDYGWFDQHHAGGPGTYHDNLYNNPTSYAKYINHKNEIIYWGEEGAIGTPPRLQLIRNTILKNGKNIGWQTSSFLRLYHVYDNFLKTRGFTKAFPNVDSLTRKMGDVAYYYQGRVIENVRINNIIDGYAINGWESEKLENHSGIVDDYRNLKGDPNLIARYNRPLYVAVKLNHKVLQTGNSTTVDLYIVNEKNVKGNCELKVKATSPEGKVVWEKQAKVHVTGGSTYGQLLVSGLKLVVTHPGYTTVSATLTQHGKVIATGDDKIFAVKLNTANIPLNGQVADTSGVVSRFLHSVGINSFTPFKSGRPTGSYLVVGAFNPQQTGHPLVTDILEWVNDGRTLIIAGNSKKWADYLAQKDVIDYRGMKMLGTSWYGGNFFVKKSSLFAGLPQQCVFNWEYQCLADYHKFRAGMRIYNGETVVGCVSDHQPEVYSALSVIPLGRGKIILTTLDLLSCIEDVQTHKLTVGDGENASMNTFNRSAKNPANIVGQQLLLNLIRYAGTDK